jgi:phosphatidylglycerol:prolipoprotein diacylglycerol transferase
MLVHPEFDPIAISIGPLAVRWYGLMYLVGFAGFFWLGARRIQQNLAPITRARLDDLLPGVLGVILGGRPGLRAVLQAGLLPAHPLEASRSGRAACHSTAGCLA